MENIPLENEYVYERDESVPEFFEPGYVERVINMLPPYIPEELKIYLKIENPDIEILTDPNIFKQINEEQKNRYDNRRESKKDDFFYLSAGSRHLAEILITHLALTSLRMNGENIQNSIGYQKDLEALQKIYDQRTIEILEIAFLSGDFKYANEKLERLNQPNLYDIVYSYGKNLSKNNKEIDSNEYETRVIWGCLIKNKDRIQMYISQDMEGIDDCYKKEIYIHEILHYLSIEGEEDIPRSGFTFETLKDFQKLKEIY